MAFDYLTQILNARVYDVSDQTSLDYAVTLSARLNNQIRFKREDKQPIFCFKIRGAYNRMSRLTLAQLKRGVVTSSAGNHAQGVALSAHKLGAQATVVMPVITQKIKVDAVRKWGAKVVLVGENYDAAWQYAKQLCQKEGSTFIHPFDDPLVIAGQGTIGMEILHQHPGPIEALFVPIGGGGLIGGIAAYVKQVRPEIRIIGVEPVDADTMYRSLKSGRRIKLKNVGIFADGVAVSQVGKLGFKLSHQFVDEIVRVTTDEICAAIKDIFEDTRTIMEPAGALGLAGVKRWIVDNPVKNKHLVTITSGANINFDRLRHISERAEIGEQREAVLAVTIPERAGSFKRFCSVLGKRSVSEFNYRYSDRDHAHIFVGVNVSHSSEIIMLVERLKKKGFATLDLSDNEVAKIHARHMVGGRVPELQDERIFSFEFPEYPGALAHFLTGIGNTWSITLFHYRNHGSDFGRVLCGIQVPATDRKNFRHFLKNLDYRYVEETENPVYQLFLA